MVLGCGCFFGFPDPISAQTFSIDWFKIAGGGGTSTNGAYALTGTIGQSDAGPTMAGGGFSIVGGFWVVPEAVQVEGAPTLTITRATPGFATISWATNSLAYALEETWSLSPPNWTNSASGTTNTVTVPIIGAAKFFRVRKL